MTFLKVNNISKTFDQQDALRNIDIEISEGKIFGLLGPNGAGKTTLIRIINQIIVQDEGEISIAGERLNASHLPLIGYLPEERGLYKKMKISVFPPPPSRRRARISVACANEKRGRRTVDCVVNA